ncbi:DgyrCDS285 [Dimorphilus gyrociliatus]|uniref:DgyrCDS285 n=1 Tax=Dimorphilus gyrociliatus TaxID=2664684 RepID=A0A7I8V6W6_9ANNE|nr:DgyrCDS285 [Dimorphilus gyrociliatus]
MMTNPEDEKDSDEESLDEESFHIKWLFDKHHIGHLPLEEQIKFYKHRNLKPSHIFRFGWKTLGKQTPKRVRIHEAPKFADLNEQKSDLIFLKREQKSAGERRRALEKAKKLEEEEKEHSNWINERKKLREDLKMLDDVEKFIRNKPHATEMEKRVVRRKKENKNLSSIPSTPEVEKEERRRRLKPKTPILARPVPVAIKIIEEYLVENELRLLDLFTHIDKTKDWIITRDQLRSAIRRQNIPISDVDLEDLVLTLDKDLDDCLDYRELARGMTLLKTAKYNAKRREVEESVSQTPDTQSVTPNALFPPEIDNSSKAARITSPEDMVDLRKRDREAKKFVDSPDRTKHLTDTQLQLFKMGKSFIKSGDENLDELCYPSTIGGSSANLANDFKMKQSKELNGLLDSREVPASADAIKRALFIPKDKTKVEIGNHLRFPSHPVQKNNSKHEKTARQQKKEEYENKIAKKLEKKQIHLFPSSTQSEPVITRMKLSTGKAYIHRKIDCWLTMERYQELTKNKPPKYLKPIEIPVWVGKPITNDSVPPGRTSLFQRVPNKYH